MDVAKFTQAVTYWPTYLILKFFVCYKVEGQENLNDLEDKGVIFASNHASYIDGPISAASMPRSGWYPKKFFPMRFLAAKNYFNWNNPFPFPLSIFAAAYVRLNGSIPVLRGKDIPMGEKLNEALKKLMQKQKIWIYPEGKITKDGNLQEGKPGMVFLHQKSGALIVPVALIGTFGILSLKNILKRQKVKVKIGKPINSLRGLTIEENVGIIMSRIQELLKGGNKS